MQNRYNVADRSWEGALKYCEQHALGFMPWSPVGGGRSLKDDVVERVAKEQNASVYQVAIAWLLRRSPVMLPIPGTSSVAHLEDNMAAVRLQLTDWQMKALDIS